MLYNNIKMFREEVINVQLAKVLSEHGLNASPENIIKHSKLPDVIINVQGIKIIIEGRTGNKAGLIKLAKRRIENGLTEISIAVFYNEDLKNSETLEELKNKIKRNKYSGVILHRVKEGIKETSFNDKGIDEFVSLIQTTISLIVNLDILKEIIRDVKTELERIVEFLSTRSFWFDNAVLIDKLKRILALEDVKKDRNKKDLIRIALFILFDTMIFHENISNAHIEIKPLSSKCVSYKEFFNKEWEKILKIDYEPIFMLAKEILNSLPTGSPETEEMLKQLKNIAYRTLSSGVLRRHDFMGRIYHKLLLKTTGSYYATYYTAIPSAYLLAKLTLGTPNEAWKFNSLEDLRNFRIIDPACGSGTLLSASYIILRDMFLSVLTEEDWEKFHKILLENSLYGLDILDYAAHLTLTILGLHNPNVIVSKSNIYTLQNGVDEYKQVYLGSLTYLHSKRNFVGKTWSSPIFEQAMNGKKEKYIDLNLPKNKFNVVIMNPPFTRTAGSVNIKFGYATPETKKIMDEDFRNLIKENSLTGVGQAGFGALFIVLAHKLTKEMGRIAIVIPRAILSGVSWKKIRDLILKNYKIKYIISNHDAGDRGKEIDPWCFSEDTDLGEVMIIMEKNNNNAENAVIYVNMWEKPSNELEAIMYAQQILDDLPKISEEIDIGVFETIKINNKEVGAVYKINQNKIKDNWLAPCLFSNPTLNKFTLELNSYIQKKGVPLSSLVNDYRIGNRIVKLAGMDRKQVHSLYERTQINTNLKGFFGHQVNINKIELNTYHFLKPKSQKSIKYYNLYSSNLLIGERIWLNTLNLISLYAPEALITTMFWEINLKEEYKPYGKLIALWLNSTLGLITFLSKCINNKGPWFDMKKGELLSLHIPEELLECKEEEVDELFNKFKDEEFMTFSKEFELATKGEGVRKQIDDVFLKILKLDTSLINYYEMLSKEPIITNKRL